jgi:hypothetical protein
MNMRADTNMEYRIPDDVWEGRCRWCVHRVAEQNKAFTQDMVWKSFYDKEKPCRIISICRADEIEGECGSFTPNHIYGICMTCKHDNYFHEGFCEAEERPNYRQVYIGQGYQNEAYYGGHRLSTCDNYSPAPMWIDTMRRQAAEGRIPRNFNPETMKPIGDGFAETKDAIRAWENAEEAYRKEHERKEAARLRKLAEDTAKATGQVTGQMTMQFWEG